MPLAHAIDLCLAGDRSAFAVVVAAHAESVRGLLRRLLGSAADAEDVAQDAFVRAYENLHRFDRRRPLKPWLLRIARNLAYNHLAASTRRGEVVGEVGVRSETTAASEAASPASAVLEQEQRNAVDAVLVELRPEFREVLVYRYVERLDYEEIAAVMGVPIGTVKTWLFRAKEQFRERASGREIF